MMTTEKQQIEEVYNSMLAVPNTIHNSLGEILNKTKKTKAKAKSISKIVTFEVSPDVKKMCDDLFGSKPLVADEPPAISEVEKTPEPEPEPQPQPLTPKQIYLMKKNEISKRCNREKYHNDEEHRKLKIQKALERYHATKQLKGRQSTNPYYIANAEKLRKNALEKYHSKKVKDIE